MEVTCELIDSSCQFSDHAGYLQHQVNGLILFDSS